ncbi:MAG: polyphosphate kinase 1 [Chitinophagaceae bacterium]|nr:polyphosphate kinase 1 [Chitinophagaceae bacterium]MDP1763781.1 polyphosphate kinase 1 [Sediminibacterium sp.]MDP1811523.1 polyphosphate kinase 1 [Sediminibacterium sp.]MDP3127281.1 polyphosphate kinase 1 [Sediminibacterium sp.]MDP3667957.1 polyphosphate kinase 1 [Sediminibacterium sp.]
MPKKTLIQRDISWLSFNARVLQEANDPTVPLKERIRFLGIFSNNSDEFFRVRVATLKRMLEFAEKRKKLNMHMEEAPQTILDQIQTIVLQQQNEFNRIWTGILKELKKENIHLVDEKHLTKEQQLFVKKYFDEEVRSNIIPLMIESLPQLPYLRDKSIYLGVVMRKKKSAYQQKYSLIEVPAKAVGRFILLPSKPHEKQIILLEDVIRFNLPHIFSYFEYDQFDSHVFKVTKDAELDIDNDVSTTFVEKIEKGLKNRRKGKPVRFVYDKEMDAGLLEYLIRRLSLNRKSNIIPGGRIHNFRHFMDFPDVFNAKSTRRAAFTHAALQTSMRVTDVIVKQDVMLHFPYHSFNAVIDLLREAAMDPDVTSIKITAYRLASHSKVINALINAARNGKEVVVMLELKARFDEEANLEWKKILEEEGVTVLLGIPKMKIHAKLCIIKKRQGNKTIQYGFVSTGNLNEKTATIYGDHCLLTSNRNVMADINRIFHYLGNWKTGIRHLQLCKTLLVCPLNMRRVFLTMIDREIRHAKAGKKAGIILKVNSISDALLIHKLNEAARAGVEIRMVVRGIFCALTDPKKTKGKVSAISIVDEYLEHARVIIFHNLGKEKIFISSADWMVRNLDHRIEAAVPINDPAICAELKDIIHIQLRDNVKARILDNELTNIYVPSAGKKRVRSQIETYHYLYKKNIVHSEVSRH